MMSAVQQDALSGDSDQLQSINVYLHIKGDKSGPTFLAATEHHSPLKQTKTKPLLGELFQILGCVIIT